MILLLTAVVPMLVVRSVQAISIYRLQDSVATGMRDRLTNQADRAMLQTVDGYARTLDQETRLAFALLKAQAEAVERRLDSPVPRDAEPVPTSRDFAEMDEQRSRELQVVLSQRHALMNDRGEFDPLAVSYATQVVLPTTRRGELSLEARRDIARLADMTEVYRSVYEQADEFILWQYTSLKSGLHFSYPGKAGFPPGFSPQQRGWYREAIAADQAIGTRPFVDASTQQLVITFAQPVRGPFGQVAGVTAIDLRVSRLLDPAELNTDWADQAVLKVVAAYPPVGSRLRPGREREARRSVRGRDESGLDEPILSPDDPLIDSGEQQAVSGFDTSMPPDVYVVADIHQQRQGRMQLSTTQTIAFDSDEVRQRVVADLLEGRSGVQRVIIDGEDRMIAYGRIGLDDQREVFAMISAPTGRIFAPVESAITQVEKELRASLVTTGAILLLLLLVVAGVAFGLSDRLTRPIVQMAEASRRVAKGDLEARVSIDRNDELGELGRAFNEMVPALRDRMRIRDSLAVAMQVQQSLLPDKPPTVPGLDIAGHSEYCDETGGDYYDFIELDHQSPNTLAVAVGDVTGHGVAAALLMATGRALIRAHASHPEPLGQVFTQVNRQLCNNQFTGRFMTLMYLVIDSAPDEQQRIHARFLSAGHDPVVVYRPDEDRFIELAGNDIPLGIERDWAFHEHRTDDLRPGDILVAGTDGIWECFNCDGEQFGKQRMCQTIQQNAKGSAKSIATAISDACRTWRGARDQDDDITMVVIKLSD